MTKNTRLLGGPNAGIYVVMGPLGVEVGEAADVEKRNFEYTRLGIPWVCVRRMPGSTRKERCHAEVEVADSFEYMGFVVVTCNSTKKKSVVQTLVNNNPVTKAKRSETRSRPEVNEKYHEGLKRAWTDPSHRKRVSEGVRRSWTDERRKKHSDSIKNWRSGGKKP